MAEKKKPAAKKKTTVKKSAAAKPKKAASAKAKKPTAAKSKTAKPAASKSKPAAKTHAAPAKPARSSSKLSLKSLMKNKIALIAGGSFLALIVVTAVLKTFPGILGGPSGTYKCEGSFYDSLEFTSGKNVYITALGLRSAGTFEVDGDRIILTDTQGKSLVFTKENGALVTNIPLFGQVVCKK